MWDILPSFPFSPHPDMLARHAVEAIEHMFLPCGPFCVHCEFNWEESHRLAPHVLPCDHQADSRETESDAIRPKETD